MKLTGENIIQAPRLQVWEALNSADVLKETIPGAQTVEQTSADEFEATVEIKIGPVKAKFKGKINLLDIDPPNGYKITGQGSGGTAGFAKGSAIVNLSDGDANTTKLVYDVDAQVGGKLAQVGQRLIQSASKTLADQFFNNLENYFNSSTNSNDISKSGEMEIKQSNGGLFATKRNKVIFAIIVFVLSFLYFYNK
ncbi:MAG: carbon monoxide dehydrogenase [Rhodobiaceae bacterium]|nr:carbon monoxide dehydrogenase [Rhodobiaceae bacterium]RPF96824.1 MAG: carbon monoxide dehydrogenase [Rhizobiales bacterium TMED227]|tara:strand:- start:520 stop:1104 length:585 start_codon:yes stop_codon:yes gene_type:complete